MAARHRRSNAPWSATRCWQVESPRVPHISPLRAGPAQRVLCPAKLDSRGIDNCKQSFLRRCTGIPMRAVAHLMAMSCEQSQLPDYREARHPSRIYTGSRSDRGWAVVVLDSALPTSDDNPRVVDPRVARGVVDYCECFQWGDDSAGSRQLAVALLLDVTGDAATAVCWHERFAQTYVSKLGATWTVPEIDVALWLYCFENSRPGA